MDDFAVAEIPDMRDLRVKRLACGFDGRAIARFDRPVVLIIVRASVSWYSITQTSVETLNVGDCGRSAVTDGPAPRDFRLNLKRHRLDGCSGGRARSQPQPCLPRHTKRSGLRRSRLRAKVVGTDERCRG